MSFLIVSFHLMVISSHLSTRLIRHCNTSHSTQNLHKHTHIYIYTISVIFRISAPNNVTAERFELVNTEPGFIPEVDTLHWWVSTGNGWGYKAGRSPRTQFASISFHDLLHSAKHDLQLREIEIQIPRNASLNVWFIIKFGTPVLRGSFSRSDLVVRLLRHRWSCDRDAVPLLHLQLPPRFLHLHLLEHPREAGSPSLGEVPLSTKTAIETHWTAYKQEQRNVCARFEGIGSEVSAQINIHEGVQDGQQQWFIEQ